MQEVYLFFNRHYTKPELAWSQITQGIYQNRQDNGWLAAKQIPPIVEKS
jgi:hypothetical protein